MQLLSFWSCPRFRILVQESWSFIISKQCCFHMSLLCTMSGLLSNRLVTFTGHRVNGIRSYWSSPCAWKILIILVQFHASDIWHFRYINADIGWKGMVPDVVTSFRGIIMWFNLDNISWDNPRRCVLILRRFIPWCIFFTVSVEIANFLFKFEKISYCEMPLGWRVAKSWHSRRYMVIVLQW